MVSEKHKYICIFIRQFKSRSIAEYFNRKSFKTDFLQFVYFLLGPGSKETLASSTVCASSELTSQTHIYYIVNQTPTTTCTENRILRQNIIISRAHTKDCEYQ